MRNYDKVEVPQAPIVVEVESVTCDGCGRHESNPARLAEAEAKTRAGMQAFVFETPGLDLTGWVEVTEAVLEPEKWWRRVSLKLFCPDCRGKAGV